MDATVPRDVFHKFCGSAQWAAAYDIRHLAAPEPHPYGAPKHIQRLHEREIDFGRDNLEKKFQILARGANVGVVHIIEDAVQETAVDDIGFRNDVNICPHSLRFDFDRPQFGKVAAGVTHEVSAVFGSGQDLVDAVFRRALLGVDRCRPVQRLTTSRISTDLPMLFTSSLVQVPSKRSSGHALDQYHGGMTIKNTAITENSQDSSDRLTP